MGTRVMYPKETKLAAIEMKKAGYTTKQIMDELHIMNKTQVKTWWRWYRNGELHRLEQPVGKQYTFGFGPQDITDGERKNNRLKFLEQQVVILKKYNELERKWRQTLR